MVAVDVIKIKISSAVILILSLIACGVDLKDTTPGAFGKCAPTDAEVVNFHTNVMTPDIDGNPASCTNCHAIGAGIADAIGAFSFHANAATLNARRENYCTIRSFGYTVYEAPQSGGGYGSHTATPASLINLKSFLDGLFN